MIEDWKVKIKIRENIYGIDRYLSNNVHKISAHFIGLD